MPEKLIIGSRGSPLALRQTQIVQEKLNHLGIETTLVKVKTSGDIFLDKPLHQLSGVGVFVAEIDERMLSGETDLAVHGMKDLPTKRPQELTISAVLKRDSPFDVLVGHSELRLGLESLKEGARVGPSSMRRTAQLRRARPDLQVESLHGNLQTRLRKLNQGHYPIRALSHHLEKIEKGNRVYWHGDMHGHQVYLTRCDPGKVNAVIATQQLLDFFTPDCLFNMGSSGALAPDLEVGDIVVATDAIQHDFDLTGWGMKPGQILFDVVSKPETGQLGFTSRHAFVTDSKLTDLAFETAHSLNLDEIKGHKPTVYKGRVVSGDQFISSTEKAGQLLAIHNALCSRNWTGAC